MTTVRRIEHKDKQVLATSLATDSFHSTTDPDFFFAPGSVCNVYEDDKGPVLFLRGTKSLRLDIQFVSNNDFERNRGTMLDGFPGLIERAKRSGFTEIVFCSNSPLLMRFCRQKFGFEPVNGELRKLI